ncbi:MAG: VOC family protein [Gaiellales bacterium]|jgi:catechol 2,3-dioxygenase-like lactoylglutathione lyase family enzyme
MNTSAPVITGVDFVTVSATDFPASVRFYGEVLGLPQTARYGSRDGAEFEAGGLTLSLIRSEAMGMTFAVNTHPIAFHVEDMEAARAELESRGVEFAADTLDTGVCLMAFFRDPAGNALMLHHRYAPRTPLG